MICRSTMSAVSSLFLSLMEIRVGSVTITALLPYGSSNAILEFTSLFSEGLSLNCCGENNL